MTNIQLYFEDERGTKKIHTAKSFKFLQFRFKHSYFTRELHAHKTSGYVLPLHHTNELYVQSVTIGYIILHGKIKNISKTY